MSERYTRLFALPENLYAEGSPVIISAGALLKDNTTGKVLAQLKIKSISDKTIKAVRVCITQYDVAGNALDDCVNKELLDLEVERNSEFGQKTAIMLPSSSTRSFSVVVTEVIFADNSIWKSDCTEWTSVIRPIIASAYFENDTELLKQYKLDYNVTCKNMFVEDRDLWICSCGNVNKNSETECYGCGCLYETLKNFDIKALEKSKNERVEEENRIAREEAEKARQKMEQARQKAQERIEARKKKAKKAFKIIVIIAVVAILCVASWFAAVNFIIPTVKYNNANSKFQNAQYEEAISIFIELGDFKDSSDKIKEVKYVWASKCFDDGDYELAFEKFGTILGYEDASERRIESGYQYALYCMQEKTYTIAIKYFEYIGGTYKDTAKLREECFLELAKKNYKDKNYKNVIYYLSKAGLSYKDSKMYKESQYQIALIHKKNGYYDDALKILKELDVAGYEKAKNQIYKTGIKALEDKSFNSAISAFKYLGNYKDSKSQINAAKYVYVKDNKDNEDTTTYKYLKELKAIGYKDSAKIYKDLYAWKVDVVVNDNQDNYISDMSSISKYKKWYFHVSLSGGEPNAKVQIKYKGYFPNGSVNSGEWDSKWSDGWRGTCWFYYNNPAYGAQGTFTLKVFDEDGNLLATKSVKVTG